MRAIPPHVPWSREMLQVDFFYTISLYVSCEIYNILLIPEQQSLYRT